MDRPLLLLLSGSLGGIVLLVVGFAVAGALGVSIAGQRRELALLRAVGATPRQVRRLATDHPGVHLPTVSALALLLGSVPLLPWMAGSVTALARPAALGLVVLFAFGLSWAFSVLGLLLRSPNAVMNAGFMGIFPLTFLSNVFVPPETLPSALEAFVDVNPISILATASRGLMAGNADTGDIMIVLAVAAALTAVFAPLTVRLYRRG